MESLRFYFDAGGIVMWPLLASSVVLGGVLIERTWTLAVRRRVLRRRVTPGRLASHRRVLPFFREVPPAMGLLGTVLGIVQNLILVDGRFDATRVGEGLALACVTTVYGLMIAIVATTAAFVCDWLAGEPAPARVAPQASASTS